MNARQIIEELVALRDEAATIDDYIPEVSARAWQRLAERWDAEIAQLREDAERYTCAKTLEGQVVVMKTLKTLGASYLDEKLDELIVENAAIDAQRKT
jgi:hypothetical protein